MKGYVQNIEKAAGAEHDVSHGLVYGEELPTRRDEPQAW